MSSKKIASALLAGTMALAFSPAAVTPSAHAAVDEEEPNNDFETATPISMGETVYATFDGDYYEADFFKVQLPQNGSLKITFNNDRRVEGYGAEVNIYDRYYNSQFEENLGDLDTTKPSTQTVTLSRGTYYIRMYGDADAGHPYHFKLSYVIPSTSLTSLKAGKKSFTAKWTKKSGAAYYQVRYTPVSTYRLYGWDTAKVKKVSKKKSSLKVKKLKGKKKYYTQVRVAKKIAGVTYYSSWTSKKTVLTRK